MKTLRKTLSTACMLLVCLLPFGATIAAPASDHPPASTQADGRVSINAADAQTLALKLNGIGETKAQRIVAWREANGRFERAEQLLEIKGIGEATLKKNLSRIAL